MQLSKHISKALDDYNNGDKESSLMNACISLSATSKSLYGTDSNVNYKRCINDYNWLVEVMTSVSGACLDLENTIWNNIDLDNGYGKRVINPKFADIIYHVFRCSDAHGQQVPKNYKLLPPEDGQLKWQIGNQMVCMPDQIIQALLAISILSKINAENTVDKEYAFNLDDKIFTVNEWWGREGDFKTEIANGFPITNRVNLEGLNLMSLTSSLEPNKFIDISIQR